jgi:hypothetical protein
MLRFSLLLILAFSFTAMATAFDQKLFLEKAKVAPIVAVAEVVENKRAVGFWSGLFPAVQPVRYEIKDVLKGEIEESVICANHYVVRNSRIADSRKPQLSPALFREGNHLILLLALPKLEGNAESKSFSSPVCDVPTYFSPDANYGAILAEPKLLELTQKSLKR